MARARDPIARRFRLLPGWLLPSMRKRGILVNRDECRSPMPWTAGVHGGFSVAGALAPWLPVHPDSLLVNVDQQREDQGSVLHAYRRMLALRRRSAALSGGSLEMIEPGGDPGRVLAYLRRYERDEARVYLNFSPRETRIALPRGRLHSNLRDAPEPAEKRRSLAPWEGVVVLDDRDGVPLL